MFSDFCTLIWLRLRHTRTAFLRTMHFAGTDFKDSKQVGDRIYQAYIVAFVLVALVLLWAALLDTVGIVFAESGVVFTVAIFQGALMAPLIVFVAEGLRALVAHAALSFLRQPEGFLALLGQGLGITPFVAFALLGTGGPTAILFSLVSLVMVPFGAREMTRVFRDDIRNRLVRDRLPFGSLELLVLNALPALVIVEALSFAATVLMVCSGAMSVWGIPLALLLNIALVLSGGLDMVAPEGILSRVLCFEAGAVVLVLVVGFTSLLGIAAPLSLVATGLVCFVFARLIRFGKEGLH